MPDSAESLSGALIAYLALECGARLLGRSFAMQKVVAPNPICRICTVQGNLTWFRSRSVF